MKLPAFDHTKMRWDAWDAFHVDLISYHTFVQFDTDEFVVCSRSWHPDARHVYKELHIQIVGTDDRDCPRLYIPGQAKPIPKSHLNHKGMQVLLLDLDSKRVVGLSHYLTSDTAPLVPARFLSWRVVAYYPGPDAMPVGAPVTRHYPQVLTQDQRTHINELTNACKVWLQMQPDPNVLMREHRSKPTVHVNDCVDVSFSVLTEEHRTVIALKGFNTIVKDEHPWLTFDVTTTTFDADIS